MRIALGSDLAGELPEAIDRWLRERSHSVRRHGALAPGADDAWPSVGGSVAEAGAGVSIAANKVPGIRAALCADAQTAQGVREWNDANVLCLSIRATSAAVAGEMLTAWFAGRPTEDPAYRAMIDTLRNH